MKWVARTKEIATSLGLPLVGVVDYDFAEEHYRESLHQYENWIQNQNHAQMNYLERGLDLRRNPKLLFPDLKSVLVAAIPYSSKPLGKEDPLEGPKFARYLRGEDYHQKIKSSLRSWVAQIQNEFPEFRAKICVDTSAVLERTWGALTGLGWIGKNTMLIHPKLGSYFFLGVVFTNLRSEVAPQILPNYCGNCEKCLVLCPTQALENNRVLNSKKCISYLTLESRGNQELPDSVRENISPWIAGCDVCQEVCPFNQKVSRAEVSNPSTTDDALAMNWDELGRETEESYLTRTKNSALSRVKYPNFMRNLSWAQPFSSCRDKQEVASHKEIEA